MRLPLHKNLSNPEVAYILSFIGKILGIDPKNKFRTRAYEEASNVIDNLSYDLVDSYKELGADAFQKQMDDLPGIGQAISAKLRTLYETGDVPAMQKYVADIPEGVFALVKIHGIGAKRALQLAKEFGLDNRDTAVAVLLTKVKHGLVQNMAGFGSKSEQKLLMELESSHQKSRIKREEALEIADKIKQILINSRQVTKVEYLGSLRRNTETVGDIDIGAVSDNTDLVVKYLTNNFKEIDNILVSGPILLSFVTKSGRQVDIKYAPESEWGSFIQHFSGSKEHNIALRKVALKNGYSLSEHGIKVIYTGEMKTFASEEDFYNFLGFKWIPPEERVGGKELTKYKKYKTL